jgi:hypothetical protein
MRRRTSSAAELAQWDAAQNARYVRGDDRILVLRDAELAPHFYDLVLDWLALYFPDVRARFELRSLPCRVGDWSPYKVLVPWFQDPLEMWLPRAYDQVMALMAECDRRDLPVVNRVDRHTNAAKSTGATLIAGAGLRTARMAVIDDEDAFRRTRLGIPLPLFVREDWSHGSRLLRADTEAEARALPVRTFRRPVAVELIDLRSPDGLYRKYRYVVAGDSGVRQSLHVTRDWLARGGPEETVFTEALRDEEIDYTSRPEPHHERFVAAARALGLDFVAFDYSLDGDGNPVVWEGNLYPLLHLPGGRRRYRRAPTTRVLAAMAKLYLVRAGLDVPDDLEAELLS